MILTLFRVISVLEGLSFITLLAIAYVLNMREHLFIFGMTHGVLFMIYFVASLVTSHKMEWSVLFWGMVLGCAFVPFAFIPLEMKMKKMAQDS